MIFSYFFSKSDLQKIVRNAKKMNEKMALFYKVIFHVFYFIGSDFAYITLSSRWFKELNRVRKAALSFGFYELFEGLAMMLERELSNTNVIANPETILQLSHSINCLRSNDCKDYRKDILPFVSNIVTNPAFLRKN